MDIQQVRIEDFDYNLPESRIAQHPLSERDASKLLCWSNGSITDRNFRDLPSALPESSVLVFNDSKVIHARMDLFKETGGKVEVFCLSPVSGEVSLGLARKSPVQWNCLLGGAKKWKGGTLSVPFEGGTLFADRNHQTADGFNITFSWDPPDLSFAEVLSLVGKVPLPPYMNRQADADDPERYQTVYARQEGSVAAPTAGLHFTDRVMNALSANGFGVEYVTLHVGAGTFMPVKSETIGGHPMHAEWIDISAKALRALSNNETIIPVGTTSLRTLESAYWISRKIETNNLTTVPELEQWDAYQLPDTEREYAFNYLADWLDQHCDGQLLTQTRLLIGPGYDLKVARGIITNFHQPKSTLLLLIHAFTGDDWKQIYQYALDHDYRFLSYGDSSLIIP